MRTYVGGSWVLASLLVCIGCVSKDVESAPFAPPVRPVLSPTPAAPPPLASPAFPSRCPRGQPKDPIEYGVCQVDIAKAHAKTSASVDIVVAGNPAAALALSTAAVRLESRPESYAIVPRGAGTLVVGSDPAGAMYGALELAERLELEGASALPLRTPVTGSPATPIRGANPFLLLPMEGETSWWFRDPSFWSEFLDMMARGRLNFLDLHGMGNFQNTNFPNVLLWMATSPTFPDIGVPRAEREKNLAMLAGIVQLARARGIRVGLMSYRADLSPLAEKDDETESELDDAQIQTYTREAVLDLVKRTPNLAYFGFRVGESKRKPAWYADTFLAGIKAAHSGASAYTRTWLTDKKDLMGLLEASGPETIVEAKYNGEQFGPPYVIAGGHMTRWRSYSYEDYLAPPHPYRFVLQIRAGGTSRIFRSASYERVARAVRGLGISPNIQGFSYEAPHAYTPQRDFYHVDSADAFSPWTFRRDELGYMLFGRLGYDPETPDKVFRRMLAERVGTDELWDVVQAASDIVQWIQTANTCGPDQRDYAPELELGGSVAYWASPSHPQVGASLAPNACNKGHFAFDAFAVAMPNEAAADLVLGRGTSRLSPVDIGQIVLADAKQARAATKVKIDTANPEARDYVRECVALADLGDWFGHKLRGAVALAVYERTGALDWVNTAKSEVAEADDAFRALARDTAYIAPFDERMRMRKLGKTHFHWREELPLLASDPTSIDEVVAETHGHPPKAAPSLPGPKAWLDAPRGAGPGLSRLDIVPMDPLAASWTVSIVLASPPPKGSRVNLLYRTFRSDGADWATQPATGSGTSWKATVPGTGEGGMFAFEVAGGPGQAFRYPDVRKEMPYRVVAP